MKEGMLRIKARTVLQLGAELISSDGVAFYELVKNAFDAGSPRCNVDVIARLSPGVRLRAYATIDQELNSADRRESRAKLAPTKDILLAGVQDSVQGAGELRSQIEAATDWLALRSAVDDADYIEISDTGTGMSAATLREAFLTIGTPMRLKQRSEGDTSTRPVLGEKGLGRLAAMRLGMGLQVTTSLANERADHRLILDWRAFAADVDAYLEDITIPDLVAIPKRDREAHGTTLRISALAADWPPSRLHEIVLEEFSRFLDPFADGKPFPKHDRTGGGRFGE